MSLTCRKKNRLEGYDYRRNAAYFVTICTHHRVKWFGAMRCGKMCLNDTGRIISRRWQWLAGQYPYVVLDAFAIMPNHIHGIIYINARPTSGTVEPFPTR